MTNTLDVTMSGYPAIGYRFPNGTYRYFQYKNYISYWKEYHEHKHKTLNLLNVESFELVCFPIVSISFLDKHASKFKRFWYDGWYDDKLYDVNIELIGIKNVTSLKMRSGDKMLVDESVDCLKNAIDACIWTADAKYLV